jgi:hypothetical protein
MKEGLVKTLVLIASVILPRHAFSYEVGTHEDMSEVAALSSLLPQYLPTIGLESLDDELADINTRLSVVKWIRRGANDEDDTISTNFARYRNHFFDPQHGGRGLSALASGEPSPDWALEDTQTFISQSYSFKEARQHFFDALTLKDNREQFLAETFYTLGHVIHHIQDMAQPQHTRNDSHGGFFFGPRSRYELYTDEHRDELSFSNRNYNPDNVVHFDTARQFWETGDGKGMAEFSSDNFVSHLTNFRGAFDNSQFVGKPNESYPLPVPSPSTPTYYDAYALLQPVLQSIGKKPPIGCAPPNNLCVMAFFSSMVTDKYRLTASRTNIRASTASIFDQDLQINGKFVAYPNLDKCTDPSDPSTCEQIFTNAVFALNRFNFDEAQKFLIPRAVAYSAGLINYFFRGRLSVSEASFTGDGSGVSVSLRVKNDIDPSVTPAWKDEDIYAVGAKEASTFVLTARYELGGGKNFVASSRVTLDPSEDDVIKPGETTNQTLAFTLPPIPANATKVEFRLVFRGKLGQEEGAVAVGMVNPIAGFAVSPNYIPSDGIGGTRAIFKRGNSWVLGPQQQVLAGNIDWKGAYIGDRPTNVLSWRGPRGRYFGTSNDRFGYEIYQHGRVWAVTPGPVLGAAITKDASGKEWVVAICQDGMTDVVYRRPNTESASSALYDPDVAPEGWQQLGSFTQDPTVYLQANSPWFFNGNGTEAQTMRLLTSKIAHQAHRLKITVTNAASASIVNLGNLPGIHYVQECEADFIQEGDAQPRQVSSHFSESRSGSYIVAVDYLNMTERLAQYSVEASGSSTSAISDSSTIASKAENSFVLILSVGGSTVTLTMDERTDSISIVPDGYHREETLTTRDVAPYAMDLRYGLVAIQNQEVDNKVVVADAAGFPSVGTQTVTIEASKVEAKVTSNLGPDVQVFLHADPPSRYVTDRFSQPNGVACTGNSTHESTYYIYIFNADVFEGAWLVDSNRNLFGTEIYNDSYHATSGAFSYISGGNLDQIIPPGSSASLYDPAGVIR